MDKSIRIALWERAQGMCEITGHPLGEPESSAWEAHHRRPKGMGGTRREDKDWLSNLLALTAFIHNGGPRSVHGNPYWSRPRGYLVSNSAEWAGMVPVFLRGQRWVMLGDHRGYLLPPEGLDLQLPEVG